MPLRQATTARAALGALTALSTVHGQQPGVTHCVVCRWDCHGLPVEHEIDKLLGELAASAAKGQPEAMRHALLSKQQSFWPGASVQTIPALHTRRAGCAGVKRREDVLNMGIGVYNEECRKIVMR